MKHIDIGSGGFISTFPHQDVLHATLKVSEKVSGMESRDVLVVEDEPMICLLIEEALMEAGYTVTTAAEGQEALDFLNSQGQRFVGIVTDIRMPGVLTGWDVAQRARQCRHDMAIIYVSGDSGSAWAAHGVSDSIFISKPFHTERVVAAFDALLNKSN